MKSSEEILQFIEALYFRALARPHMFACSPQSLEVTFLALDKLREFILSDSYDVAPLAKSYGDFLQAQGFGAALFTTRCYPTHPISEHDKEVFQNFCEFWKKYLASRVAEIRTSERERTEERGMVNRKTSLLDHVAYLHDAKCLELTWDCSRPEERVIRMKVIVDPDAELPSWNGKTVLITLSDVVVARLMGWGYATGDECIDNWRQGVSDFLERECEVLVSKGITIPSLKFTIAFHSGSELEVICSEASALVTD
jgi:hypothetical protein